ncbi:MAG: LysR family transcriptional regulator, partial [Rhizobiales bacterium]|nr:LysR family transcriptional regulator [Hyphomicrobiales bacterium]
MQDRPPKQVIPSLTTMRCFESAAHHESFTQAAEELHLTQSSISRQIKELEYALGFDLFRRVGRRVVLTEAGAIFAKELSIDLERIRQTVFRAIAAGDRKTALRIATLPGFGTRWLIPRISEFE